MVSYISGLETTFKLQLDKQVNRLQRPRICSSPYSYINQRLLAFNLALRSAYKRALQPRLVSQEIISLYFSWVMRFIEAFRVSSKYLVKAGFTVTKKETTA